MSLAPLSNCTAWAIALIPGYSERIAKNYNSEGNLAMKKVVDNITTARNGAMAIGVIGGTIIAATVYHSNRQYITKNECKVIVAGVATITGIAITLLIPVLHHWVKFFQRSYNETNKLLVRQIEELRAPAPAVNALQH